ncbi:MAG: NigD-like protein [Prevotella sp.]|jgi:hypothetical protein
MKKYFKMMGWLLCLALTSVVLQSCDDDDDDDYYYMDMTPNAIVSVYSNSDGHPMLVLNDSTVLWPVNLRNELYGGKRMRAFVNLRTPKESELDGGIYGDSLQNTFVNWIDTIRTKEMAVDKDTLNDSIYGNDPLEIVDDWVTCVEDGFLTIRFRTIFGSGKVHTLNLVKGSNSNEVVIHHDADGDLRGNLADGMMAFSLQKLGLTPGTTQELTVKWNSFSGTKEHKFTYRVPLRFGQQ